MSDYLEPIVINILEKKYILLWTENLADDDDILRFLLQYNPDEWDSIETNILKYLDGNKYKYEVSFDVPKPKHGAHFDIYDYGGFSYNYYRWYDITGGIPLSVRKKMKNESSKFKT